MIRKEGARLAVVIPTFRRPEGLVAALDSLAAQRIGEPFVIVVADNDSAEAAGVAAAKAWAAARGLGDAVTAIAVAERGISQNRNAGLAAAFATSPAIEAAAMIDDDATADPDWLAGLAATRRLYEADIVCGPQIFEFPADAPDWARDANPFLVLDRPTGPVADNRSMCSAIIARSLWADWGDLFDPAFGRSGGEDVDLFTRCASAARPMAWCAEASVREWVPSERLTQAWILERAFRTGHSMARIDMKYRRARAIPRQAGLAVRTAISGAVRAAFGGNASRRFDGMARLWTGAGRIAGLAGRLVVHY